MLLKEVHQKGTCAYCGKERKVVKVELENHVVVLLCFGDLEKQATMRMLTAPEPKRAETTQRAS